MYIYTSETERKMLVHVEREYNISKISLSLLGLWPSQNKIIRSFLPLMYLLFLITFCPLEMLMLVDHWNDEDKQMIFESSYQLLLLVNFFIKLFCEYWNHDMICRLYEAIEYHWNVLTNKIEIQILRYYSDISRKLTIFYSTSIYGMMTIFMLIPITPIFLDIVWPLNETRPRHQAVIVDWRIDHDKYFCPIYCYNLGITVMGIFIIVTIDTMQVSCTAHACSLFAIVSQQLNKMGTIIYIKDCAEYGCCMKHRSSEQTMYREYITCLRKYQLALQYVDILNLTFRTIALVMVLVTATIISLVGVRTVYVLNQIVEVTRFSFVIVGMLLQLLVVCYSSQKLIDESQNVFYQAYAAEWYNFSPRLKSLLMITLRRSFAPCTLTAGNMFPLSMATYSAVVRTGISYFMTFLSLKT